MGRKQETVTDQAVAAIVTATATPTAFVKPKVDVLSDGRVEASIKDDPENPVNEMICRTSQENAAKWIFNDLCPAVLKATGQE